MMSLYDDMFDLDDYFKAQVKHATDKIEARSMLRAWKRVSNSHADMERSEMKTAPVINAVTTILRAYGAIK